ncbi:MAG: dockerin type I repeat-containing protein [Acutalibacteraceae bacterium]
MKRLPLLLMIRVGNCYEQRKTIGDVNSDGEINLADAILTQKCALSIIELSGNQMPCADANEDGNVNTLDSIFIMKYSLNIPTEVERIGEGVRPYFVP